MRRILDEGGNMSIVAHGWIVDECPSEQVYNVRQLRRLHGPDACVRIPRHEGQRECEEGDLKDASGKEIQEWPLYVRQIAHETALDICGLHGMDVRIGPGGYGYV